MALKSGFFDAAYDEQTGEFDRVYLSDDMSIFFDAIVGNGVFKDIGNGLHVIPSGAGMSISVDTGFAVALGRYMKNTELYVIQVDGADSQARIDLVVARLSTLQNERSFTLIVKKGTPALSPVAPTLIRNEAVYELGLAKINIASGTTSISSSMIEDTRKDEELCGFVSGIGGGNEFIDCTINDSADTYSSAWLFDKDGNTFIPEAGKTYRVITVGTYKNCLYLFNETTNKYEGVGSYEVELTAEEILDLWDDSSYSRLSNIPALVSNIEFTGGVVAPSWLYYDPTKVRMAGTTSATNVGTYTATFEPINGYSWPDGTVDVKYIPWSITKKVIPIPIPTRSQYEYDGTQKTLIFNDVDLSSVTITNVTGTNAGTYTATVSLNNPINTEWTDGTIAQKTIPMIITKKVIPIPVPTQTQFTYDGEEKEVVFNNLDTDNVTIANNTATNIGTYSAIATLNDNTNMVWSDGVTGQKAWSYRIGGMQNIITLSTGNVSLENSSGTGTVTVTSSSGGTITAVSSDTTIANVSVSGNVITVTPGSYAQRGNCTVTVTVAGNGMYEDAAVTFSVVKDYGINVVTWANGTDEEIVAMVEAADRGEIDLHDYWHVGDEREVTLSVMTASGSNSYGSWDVPEAHAEQKVTLVLMDTNKYELVTPVLNVGGSARNTCSFIVGLKEALGEGGRIDEANDIDEWSDSSRREWCSTAFIGSIPSAIRSVFKKFKIAHFSGSSVVPTYLEDYFTLPNIKEVTNYTTIAGEENAYTQMEYYETAANRIKKQGYYGNGCIYWTRSTSGVTGSSSTRVRSYYCVNDNGNYVSYGNYYGLYISPFGCI